jgi:hypothetical protein
MTPHSRKAAHMFWSINRSNGAPNRDDKLLPSEFPCKSTPYLLVHHVASINQIRSRRNFSQAKEHASSCRRPQRPPLSPFNKARGGSSNCLLTTYSIFCPTFYLTTCSIFRPTLYCSVSAVLMEPATGTMTSFQTAFPRNQPDGALELVLQLLSLLLKWELDVKRIAIPVRSWVEVS